MKKQKINKHPDWRLSKAEKNWYYLGDTARLFGMTLVCTAWPLYRRVMEQEEDKIRAELRRTAG